MDWKVAIEAERAALKRIVALLLALADLAELAGSRSQAVCGFVLWILLPAEAVARNLVTGTPAPISFRQAGNGVADAMRLARNFRDLARELDCQAALAFTVDDDGPRQNEPARFAIRRRLRAGSVPGFTNALAFLTSSRDTQRLVGHDTS